MTMTMNTTMSDRSTVIETAEQEVKRWSGYVDLLLRAFRHRDEAPSALGYKIEALRHKRDTAITKVQALKHHRGGGWKRARDELEHARRELRDSWRTVISGLDRECLFH